MAVFRYSGTNRNREDQVESGTVLARDEADADFVAAQCNEGSLESAPAVVRPDPDFSGREVGGGQHGKQKAEDHSRSHSVDSRWFSGDSFADRRA